VKKSSLPVWPWCRADSSFALAHQPQDPQTPVPAAGGQDLSFRRGIAQEIKPYDKMITKDAVDGWPDYAVKRPRN